MEKNNSLWFGTTILSVRKGKEVVIAADGHVSMENLIIKTHVKKVRRLNKASAIAGFTGSTADALVLFEKLELALEKTPNLIRACVEVAKDWHKDPLLGKNESMMAVINPSHSIILSSIGEVYEPEDGLIGIGTGGPYALSAARALIDLKEFSAQMIVEKAMKIASEICVYTDANVTVESLGDVSKITSGINKDNADDDSSITTEKMDNVDDEKTEQSSKLFRSS